MTAPTTTDPREEFALKLVDDVTRSLETLSVYLGLNLGLYQALAQGASTEEEVASRTGVARRYAREWLEQQTAAGYLTCANTEEPPERRRYRLPEERAEVLLDPDSPYHTAPGVIMLDGVLRVLPDLVRAYQTGEGVPYAAYGEPIRRGIAAFNRPMFRYELTTVWLPALPDVDRRLRSDPPARVLDLGSGLGASSLAIAQGYPKVRVLGVDLDEASVAEARAAAEAAGLADRVSFTSRDAAQAVEQGPFDLITIFEALHDMGDPVGVLRTARDLLTDEGSLLVADERVSDRFTDSADLVERFQYGWSVLHCLPATLAEDPVEANGTILRAPTVRRWAREAGFTRFEIVPIDNAFWRFYRMQR